MNAQFRNRQLPYSSPLANVLVVLVGVLAIAISFVVGIVALVSLVVAVVILGIAIRIRRWWLQRNNGRASRGAEAGPANDSSTVIEGEFSVIASSKESEKSSNPRSET